MSRWLRPIAFVAACSTLVVLFSAILPAQTASPPSSANPVTDAVRQVFDRESKNIKAAAELLPADKYAYKPTPAQMSFGALMAHIAQTNLAICAGLGIALPADVMALAQGVTESQPKTALVDAVTRSFAYCGDALAAMSDAHLGEEMTAMGRGMGVTRAFGLVTIATDWADHYSTAASYLRLNGLLPPSAAATAAH